MAMSIMALGDVTGGLAEELAHMQGRFRGSMQGMQGVERVPLAATGAVNHLTAKR